MALQRTELEVRVERLEQLVRMLLVIVGVLIFVALFTVLYYVQQAFSPRQIMPPPLREMRSRVALADRPVSDQAPSAGLQSCEFARP